MSANHSTVCTEEWRPVVGYEGLYEVSDLGRIRSLNSRHPSQLRSILKPDGSRYLRVCLTKNGVHRRYMVHRLVMATFVGPLPIGFQVHHQDGNKHNNRLENLVYLNACENMGLYRRGKGKKYKKLQGEPIRCLEKFNSEVWRDVVGYEGLYEVSSSGRVRIGLFCHVNKVAGRLMKPRIRSYRRIGLTKDGKTKCYKVARLVAAAFIGPCPTGWFVNHVDANKLNDDVDNLEWVTPSENIKHSVRLGLQTGAFKVGHPYHRRKMN